MKKYLTIEINVEEWDKTGKHTCIVTRGINLVMGIVYPEGNVIIPEQVRWGDSNEWTKENQR